VSTFRNHARRYLAKESTTIVKQPLNFKSEISKAEEEAIAAQLGYTPSNLIKICATDPVTKRPQACLLYPLAVPSTERLA
jgi:hypothetical protein